MTQTLAAYSASILRIVASAAPRLSAIRIGPNRHITGLLHQNDTVVTIDRALPAMESHSVMLSNHLLIAGHLGLRDPDANVAVLHLSTPLAATSLEIAVPVVGSLVIMVGADADASPTVRLTVIHRLIHTTDTVTPVLDLPSESIDQGSLVLDDSGRLIGLATVGPNGEAMAIPGARIDRLLISKQDASIAMAASSPNLPPVPQNRRAWLGVSLQPITLPDQLVARAGQASARMVVSISKGGPAEMAGIRIGDVLLALDGTSASGPQALRAVLGDDRIGTTMEVKLLRDGNIATTHLTLAVQPR